MIQRASRRQVLGAIGLAAVMGRNAMAIAQMHYPKRMSDAEIDAVFAKAAAELKRKTLAFRAIWRGGDHWDADLEAGTITFSGQPGRIIRAPVQVIGTRLPSDSSWLWAWDHPSVPAARAADARLVKEFGRINGLEKLTTRKIIASEDEAWELTALAAHLAGATGAYRGPTGSAEVFMTFGELAISKT